MVPPLAAPRIRKVGAFEVDSAMATESRTLALHPSSLFWITGTLTDGWPFLDADGRVGLPLRTSRARAAVESPVPQAPIRRLGDLPGALADLGLAPSGVVGLEMDVVPAATLDRLCRTFPEADFRDVLGTSRKYAIPFLEYLDSNKITLRVGEVRKFLKKLS